MLKEVNISPPDKDVIDQLEELMELAKEGRIQSLAYVISMPNYRTGSGWVGMNKNNMAIIGECDVLKRDMMDDLIALRIDPETGYRRD